MFVFPSIICGYIVSIPLIAFIYHMLFKNDKSIKLSVLPTVGATV